MKNYNIDFIFCLCEMVKTRSGINTRKTNASNTTKTEAPPKEEKKGPTQRYGSLYDEFEKYVHTSKSKRTIHKKSFDIWQLETEAIQNADNLWYPLPIDNERVFKLRIRKPKRGKKLTKGVKGGKGVKAVKATWKIRPRYQGSDGRAIFKKDMEDYKNMVTLQRKYRRIYTATGRLKTKRGPRVPHVASPEI